MCWFKHVDSKCTYVSIIFFGHSKQSGFGCVIDQLFFFWCVCVCVPMYWRYLGFYSHFSICVICAYEMLGGFPIVV